MDIVLRDLEPGDAAWLVEQHAVHYARAEGFDDSFGRLVADILAAYQDQRDPTCERAWIAVGDGRRLGSVFCVRHDATTAKLRLFLLVPEARGQGLGKRLLAECMGYAQARGYRGIALWTHESHRAACGLYRAAGWRLTASRPVRSFGADLVEQAWAFDF